MGTNKFENYMESEPQKAKQIIDSLMEITKIRDVNILTKALNVTYNRKFDLEMAINWIYNDGFSVATVLEPEPLPSNANSGQTQQNQTSSNDGMTLPSFDNMEKNISNSRSVCSLDITDPPLSSKVPHDNSPNLIINPPVSASSTPSQPNDSPTVVNSSSDDDLQRAIKLSLQESSSSTRGMVESDGSGMTQEARDISIALEASLQDTITSALEGESGINGINGAGNVGAKRKRGQTEHSSWVDPINPHDRKRNGLWPVGLKNVGQSCWFSAVIQPMFFVPSFRNSVLNFECPNIEDADTIYSDKQRKIIEFMLELQKLFSLMVASQRRYVDPSKAVEILRGALGCYSSSSTTTTHHSSNNQQDVSEFTHKVIEWVEEAIRMSTAEKNAEGCATKDNPMSKLFYGQVLIEGTTNNIPFSRTEDIGQWTLHVCGLAKADLHTSLEKSTEHEYFEESNHELGGQERWFVKLPPLLFLELSRFQFNQERGQAEKIHDPLEFPDIIYMDRYMAESKDLTHAKRDEVRRLRERHKRLNIKLDSFTNYKGSGSHEKGDKGLSMALINVLQYAMHFAMSGSSSHPSATPIAAESEVVDDSMPSPLVSTPAAPTYMQVDDDNESFNRIEGPRIEEEAMELVESCDSNNYCDYLMEPRPSQVSSLELEVIKNCFGRWKVEVERSLSQLESAISEIESVIDNMYSEPYFNTLKYQLHAVMVHEGQVDSGHYWAYVLDRRRKVWLKFNDNTVSEASWDELVKDSMGGPSHASAYSLVYIDASKPELMGTDCPIGETIEGLVKDSEFEALVATLPNRMAEYVSRDNAIFCQEIQEWDENNFVSSSSNEMLCHHPGGDVTILKERLRFVEAHARLSTVMSCNIIADLQRQKEMISSEIVINLAYKHSLQRLEQDNMKTDIRLESLVLYMLKNKVSSKQVLNMVLLEQFSMAGLDSESVYAAEVRKVCEKEVSECRNQLVNEANMVRQWHKLYYLFRLSVHYFINSVESSFAEKKSTALDQIIHAYHINRQIMAMPPESSCKTMNLLPLMSHLRYSISAYNDEIMSEFQKQCQNTDTECVLSVILENVRGYIVPSLSILQFRIGNSEAQESPIGVQTHGPDFALLEQIRCKWSSLLGRYDEKSHPKAFQYVNKIFSELIHVPKLHAPGGIDDIQDCMNMNENSIDQRADSTLFKRYTEILERLSLLISTSPSVTRTE